jgi:hypothetical protein
VKTADLGLLIVGGVITLVVLVIAVVAFIRYSAGINRGKFTAMRRRTNLVSARTDQFANDIEDSINTLGDLEHPLAANIRTLVRTYRKDIREL